MVVTVPVPSVAVLAAVTAAPKPNAGVPVQMGVVFVAIGYLSAIGSAAVSPNVLID